MMTQKIVNFNFNFKGLKLGCLRKIAKHSSVGMKAVKNSEMLIKNAKILRHVAASIYIFSK